MNDFLPDVIIRRLPSYYRQLQRLEAANIEQISSSQLGEQMHQTASQIRRDLNCCREYPFEYDLTLNMRDT